jgi:hypothetical protein
MVPLKRSGKLKQRARAWYERNWLKVAIAIGIIFLFAFGVFIGSFFFNHQTRHDLEQAEKRLVEQQEAHATEIQRLEVEFDLELDRRIEQARLDAQAEMAEQLAALNQQLEEEQQAYADLVQAMDDLEQTYQMVMDTVFGPGWDQTMLPVTDPLEATAMLASQAAWYFTDNVDEYLEWKESCPPGYAHLVSTGRKVLKGEHTYPMSPGFREAAITAYNGERWDCFIAWRGCTRSPFYGKGVEVVRYLRSHGRVWSNCLATLECESTYGLGGSIYFGILYGNYSNTIEGYCALLNDHGVSNDPWEQSCFWNMPGYPRYQNGFCNIVSTMEGFWP